MQTNNFFNFNRFILLLKQDLLINKIKYLLAVLILGLLVFIYSFHILNINQSNILTYIVNPDMKNYKYYNVIRFYSSIFNDYLFAVAIIIGTAFPDLSDKLKTSKFLLNPGSTFEKFLVQFLIRIGFFIPIALGIFWIAIRLAKMSLTPETEGLAAGIDPSIIPNFHFQDLFTDYWKNEVWSAQKIIFIVFCFMTYGSYLFAGTTFFKRFAIIKTVLFSAVVCAIAAGYCWLLDFFFILDNDQKDHFYGFNDIQNELSFYSIDTAFLLLALCIPICLLFSCTYFKLKEKEV
jgi:hypothetical protein